jgi:hypothetical protein
MQSIKILTTDKGLHHWEDLLLRKLSIRLSKKLTSMGIAPFTKRDIMDTMKATVKRENVIGVYPHDISTILSHLIDDTIENLLNHVSHIKN